MFVASGEISKATWSDPGTRNGVATRSILPTGGGTYWEGGVAPELVNPASTNIAVDFTVTATEAKRLAEIAAGSKQQYYGPTFFQFFRRNDQENNGLFFHSITGNAWSAWVGNWSGSYYPVMLRDASTFKGYFDVVDDQRVNNEQLYLYPEPGKTGTINRVVANGGWGVKVSTGSYGIVNESINSGYLSMDGAQVRCSAQLTDTNLHVYAAVSTVPITNTFALACRTTWRIGGAAIGECIAFATTNTAVRRKAIEAYLCKKWLGKTIAAATVPWRLDSVDVADGATLTLADDQDYGIASLRGTGTIALGAAGTAITNVSSLATTFTGAKACTKVTVAGEVELTAAGTVTITANDGVYVRKGWYPFLATTALTGDLSKWTIENPDGRMRRAISLERQGDTLGLRVDSTGMLMLFR